MSAQFKYSANPITDLTYTGLHWVEASAGTGKTFTLASVMVRLLLAKYLPKQIIVTTFTRKAAAELRGRIRLRLREVLNELQNCRTFSQAEIEQKISQTTDPLFQVVLQEFAGQIPYAIERLNLIIHQYDELFVGTLDSFTQKLLREFNFESGVTETLKLTDNSKFYMIQITHDSLRAWIEQQPQALIDFLYEHKVFKSVESYLGLLQQASNFNSAQWQAIAEPQGQAFYQVADFQKGFLNLDFSLCQFAEFASLNKTKTANYISKLYELQQVLKQAPQAEFVQHLDHIAKMLDKLCSNGLVFTAKADESSKQRLQDTALLGQCEQLNLQIQANEQLIQDYTSYLKYYLIQQIKEKMPLLLQEQQESTFSEQTHLLAQALIGEKGENFARVVHHRYPVILVDEFQDTNHDQDLILRRIWRENDRFKSGCMVMVGDDKQAIYGFRGGDMLTYIHARQQVQDIAKQGYAHFYTLQYNHRSVAPLVQAVDALFQQKIDFGEQVEYKPIQAGSRPHPILVENQQDNPAPLRWLNVYEEENIHQEELVLIQIQHLLQQSQQGNLYFKQDSQKRAITVNDIAVLARTGKDLIAVQAVLQRHQIPCYLQSTQSVFDTAIARDVGHLLSAILQPYNEQKIHRVLLSYLFNFKVSDLHQLEQSNQISDYMQQFNDIKQLWQQKGFFTAWQACLTRFKIWQRMVQQSHSNSERLVTNLRHLSDILNKHSEIYQGMNHLLSWYQKQLNAPQERDWEIEHKLSNENGISLMTIHKSKGLEFKIVFLLSADSDSSFGKDELIFSQNAQEQRIISIDSTDQEQLEQHKQRNQSEQHRLWYVALTRASHRLYIVRKVGRVKNLGKPSEKLNEDGVSYWLEQGEFEHSQSAVQPLLSALSHFTYQDEIPQQQQLNALDLPKQKIYPTTKTSFTGLTVKLSYDHAENIEDNKSAEEWIVQQQTQALSSTQDDTATSIKWVQQNFPKGADAGLFLHSLFEHIAFDSVVNWQNDPQQREDFYSELHRRFKNGYSALKQQLMQRYEEHFPQHNSDIKQLEQHIYELLKDWLEQVLYTPVFQQQSLSQLQKAHYLNELNFNMALKDERFLSEPIEQLFKENGYHLQLQQHWTARHLVGAIDVVAFAQNQYHIIDFKSNYLGENWQDYQQENLQKSMQQSQYWLQASLYLVAMHRYLQVRLQEYDISQHLGSAHYLYLRGMNGQAGQGVLSWRPSDEFILKLDRILGYA